MSAQVIAELAAVPYQVKLSDGLHQWLADLAQEGTASIGPGPHELLLSALGACTAITLGLYAQRKQLYLQRIEVSLGISLEDAAAGLTRIERQITLEGELDQAQRERLLQVANACPIHRLLTGSVEVHSALTPL
ncbi:OsmC family protein [Pseudomonas sp. DC3000-4b1]|uniref:OsmC family protein n=1 Tax=unclassified Pseudomonas TaxID=196821 RepID=UPI003CFAA5A0